MRAYRGPLAVTCHIGMNPAVWCQRYHDCSCSEESYSFCSYTKLLNKGTRHKDQGQSEGIAPYIPNLYSIELNTQFHAAATLTSRNKHPMPLGWEISWIAEPGWDLTWRGSSCSVWNRTPSFGNLACSLITILTEIFRDGDSTHNLWLDINLLKTKRRPLYLKPQSVPRCKLFSSGL